MTIIIDVGDRVLPLLHQVLNLLQRQGGIVADIAAVLANLVAAVSAVSTDVAEVLVMLKSRPNITPEQVATLEAQVVALQELDATVRAAIAPAG